MITWGGNEKGQLGIGSIEDEFRPTNMDFFSRQGIRVAMIAAGGDMSICATESGEAFAWPY